MLRILSILLVLFILISECPSVAPLSGDRGKFPALSLWVNTKFSSICHQEDLTLEMVLKNKSKHRIAINPANLWSFITFKAYKPSRLGVPSARVLMLTHSASSHSNNDFVILKPGQVYKCIKAVSLDNQFFKEESEVEFNVSYQQLQQEKVNGAWLWSGLIDSNRVSLRIVSCN